jgi:Flp pilus assembly protein TadD
MDDASSLDSIGRRFQTSVMEQWVAQHPEDLDGLRFLAYAYTGEGRLEEALAADLRLTTLAPDRAELHYDLGCSYALLGRKDEAFRSLEKAVALGFSDRGQLLADDDLARLRSDPRWHALLARLPSGGGPGPD